MAKKEKIPDGDRIKVTHEPHEERRHNNVSGEAARLRGLAKQQKADMTE